MDGLFKEDYNINVINDLISSQKNDSVISSKNEKLAKGDLMLTGALFKVLRDLKQGRLQDDSLCWENMPTKYSYFFNLMDLIRKTKKINIVLDSLQPALADYKQLKNGIGKFIDSMDSKRYTYIKYPYQKSNPVDSLLFIKNLHIRFIEDGFAKYDFIKIPDSTMISEEISWYQRKKNITTDGKISAGLINELNLNDQEKLKRIAITLDRYKKLTYPLPTNYISVNIPAYHLKVKENDSVKLISKVICGKPSTRTPILSSAVNEIITYPTWTVPESIIKKEMLPGLKKDINYLNRKGLHLLDNKGSKIDPTAIDWSKYKNNIPYKIQQGSGEKNALGIIKFNFPNEFAVYLHDTNQRYLFKKTNRALSHGCIRVQEWKDLAFYLIRNDSMSIAVRDSIKYNTDSISNWIDNKQRHRLSIKNKFPIYVWYFSCEGENGRIKFYSDIYNEDNELRQKYFATK
jgi:murein L,D-transpeptidase YcbB/YkuD